MVCYLHNWTAHLRGPARMDHYTSTNTANDLNRRIRGQKEMDHGSIDREISWLRVFQISPMIWNGLSTLQDSNIIQAIQLRFKTLYVYLYIHIYTDV